jgi:hypothetical protein
MHCFRNSAPAFCALSPGAKHGYVEVHLSNYTKFALPMATKVVLAGQTFYFVRFIIP